MVSVTQGKRGGNFDQLVTIPGSTVKSARCRGLFLYQELILAVTEYHAIASNFLHLEPGLGTVTFPQTLTIYQYKTIGGFFCVYQNAESNFRHVRTNCVG